MKRQSSKRKRRVSLPPWWEWKKRKKISSIYRTINAALLSNLANSRCNNKTEQLIIKITNQFPISLPTCFESLLSLTLKSRIHVKWRELLFVGSQTADNHSRSMLRDEIVIQKNICLLLSDESAASLSLADRPSSSSTIMKIKEFLFLLTPFLVRLFNCCCWRE